MGQPALLRLFASRVAWRSGGPPSSAASAMRHRSIDLLAFFSLWRRAFEPLLADRRAAKMRVAMPLSIIVNGYPDIRDRISRNTRPA